MVPKNIPHAARVDEIERTERKSIVQARPSRITPPAIFFVGRADSDSSVRFGNTASCIYMLSRANPVCLPVLSHSDRRVIALRLVAPVDCVVLYCAVLAVLAVRR